MEFLIVKDGKLNMQFSRSQISILISLIRIIFFSSFLIGSQLILVSGGLQFMELLENATSWDRWHLNFEAKKFLPTKDVQLSFKAGWPRILARQFLESTMSFCKFDTAHPPSPLQCYLHCPVFAIKLVHLIESLALCSQVLLTHFC